MNTPYRYVLSERESRQWNRCQNPDMARWRRNQIIDRVTDEAISMGYDERRIFDSDEKELAQGMKTDHLVE